MKTITRLLKPLLPVVAALFFCTVASAQTTAELTAKQSELQSFIAAATQRINDANATASMTPQQITAFQAEITAAQQKLNSVTALLQVQVYEQQRLQNEANIAQRQATNTSIQNSHAQLLAAVAAQQALPTAVGSEATQPVPSNAITTVRDPNHPSNVPLFKSTGNAEQDAALLRQWLQANPISK